MSFLEIINKTEKSNRKKIMKKYCYLICEQKLQVIDDYQNSDIGLNDLIKKYNSSETAILKILKDIPKKGHKLTKINENYFQNIDTHKRATLYFQEKRLIPLTTEYENDNTLYHNKPKEIGDE